MWRVRGSRLRRSSTAGPTGRAGRMSSTMPLGGSSRASSQPSSRGARRPAVEVELVRQVDEDAWRTRVVLDDQQDAVARRRMSRSSRPCGATAAAGGRAARRRGRRLAARGRGARPRAAASRRAGGVRRPAAAALALASMDRGSVSVKRCPGPARSRASMSPPSRRASSREIDRPSPVPPNRGWSCRRPGGRPRRSAPAARRRCRCRCR